MGGLFQCKYWSVCLDFLHTLVLNVPLSAGMTSISRKGIEPSGLVSPAVNLMVLSILIICAMKLS